MKPLNNYPIWGTLSWISINKYLYLLVFIGAKIGSPHLFLLSPGWVRWRNGSQNTVAFCLGWENEPMEQPHRLVLQVWEKEADVAFFTLLKVFWISFRWSGGDTNWVDNGKASVPPLHTVWPPYWLANTGADVSYCHPSNAWVLHAANTEHDTIMQMCLQIKIWWAVRRLPSHSQV